MKPFSIYHTHNELFKVQQEKLVALIKEIAQPSMIYLLGGTLYRRRSESIFLDNAPTAQNTSDYFLLVLLNDLANKELYEWQDKIEQHCNGFMTVTVIVMQISIFSDWLQNGHRFAKAVVQFAVAIYDQGDISFSPATVPDTNTEQKAAEKYYKDGLNKGKEFLAGADLFRIRNQYKLAAFMLHQATEHCLHGLIKAETGFHAHTHNLDRLIRYGSLVSYQLPDIFPRKTEQDKRLFTLLQKAYGDARYRDDYSIAQNDLLLLTEKVRYLHEIVTGL
ncbi:MAG TPA: HEPN domain-containing protein [Chitinophagaceae bacterium]|nr:HEPN domain-containing protein [Chitinophagaceae bacterium]